MHTTIKDKVPRSKMLAQKQMLITRIAGAKKVANLLPQSVELIFRLCFPVARRAPC